MSEKTITVKGIVYDKRTGMPLHLERAEQRTKTAQQIHRSTQKSKTLNRKYVKLDSVVSPHATTAPTPNPSHVVSHTVQNQRRVVSPQAAAPAKGVVHFAPSQVATRPQRVISDIGPAPHALAVNAAKKIAKPQIYTAIKPSQIIKQEAIAKAMAQTPAKRDRQEVAQSRHPKAKRFAKLASASAAVLLLGAYLTYLGMPTISTHVAASQAGIAASYPNYQPTGYTLSGPVAYQQGKVTMTFAANAGPSTYTLDQVKSGWDSSAVLDSYVKPNANNGYETTTSNGLTIYTFDENAAWVNRGIFYTISGDAPLSDDQIQRIATSL